jgi:hypothetical protein
MKEVERPPKEITMMS